MGKYNIKEILVKASLLFPMILAVCLGINDYLGMEMKLSYILFYDAVLVFGMAILYFYPKIILFVMFGTTVGTMYLKYYHSQLFSTILRDTILFFQWLPGYIIGYEMYLEEYAGPLLLFIMFFSVLILSIFVFLRINKLVITFMGIVVFSFFWFMYVERAHFYLMIFMFSSLLLYSYSLWNKKEKEWQTVGVSASISLYKCWLGSAVLLLSLSILFMAMLPLNIRPLRIEPLNNFMVRNFPFITRWKNASDENYGYSFRFNLSNSVYKGKKLGGPVDFTGSVMFSVKGNFRNNLYLRGSVYDKYSGFNWTKSRRKYDVYDERKRIYLPEKAEFKDLNLEIIPEGLVSSTVFNALYPVKVESIEEKVFINDDLEIYATKILDGNSKYNLKVKLPLLQENLIRYGHYSTSEDAIDMYLRLPNNIPDRVKKLVDDIVSDKASKYEKAEAIQRYLRRNFVYTLKPENVPAGKDFVDYFLFESKEGYCTYYASSMVVMLRLAGIPARYVEGFLVKPDKGENKTYSVLDSHAHAWVEAYFGQWGWITFEPTPAYEHIEPWQYEYEEENESNQRDKIEYEGENTEIKRDENNYIREKEIYQDEIIPAVNKKITIDKSYIIGTIAVIIVLRILFGIIKINVLNYMKFKNSKKFIGMYVSHIIWLLSKAGYKKDKSHTFREFIKGIEGNFQIDEYCWENIITTVEGIIYGRKTLEREDIDKLKEFEDKLKQTIKSNLGFAKYFWRFYIT